MNFSVVLNAFRMHAQIQIHKKLFNTLANKLQGGRRPTVKPCLNCLLPQLNQTPDSLASQNVAEKKNASLKKEIIPVFSLLS